MDVTVLGKNISGVIDSAAQVTVIDYECWLTITGSPPIGKEVKLTQADGNSNMIATLVPDVEIQVGTYQIVMPIFVTNLSDNLLLGLDFLLSAGAVLNLLKNIMTIGAEKIPITLTYDKNQGVQLALSAKQVYIEPGGEANLSIETISNKNELQLFEPAVHLTELNVANTIVKLNEPTGFSITNTSKSGIKIKSGTVLGTFSDINIMEGQPLPHIRNVSVNNTGQLPEHVHNLFERSKVGLPELEQGKLFDILCQYSDVFAEHDLDLGCYSNIKHEINTENAAPTRLRMRRTPIHFQEEEEKHLKKLLDIGVIEPSNSEWAAAPVLIRKKDGSVRYAIDYRALNTVTVKDAFPLPLIEDCFDSLSGVQYLSGLDLASGYYQVEVADQDKQKTAFITRYGLYQHTRMGFGLCNAPATFQRAMQAVLQGLNWRVVLAYLDDVIVLGQSFDEHLDNLRAVFERFRANNLKLKPRKCELFRRQLKFLGWNVGNSGIEVPTENIAAVLKRTRPMNVREVQSFLGYVNYHRSHIEKYAELAAPLYALTGKKKGETFIWESEHEKAFEELKSAMTQAPVMKFPERSGLFILDTDASNVAIAAELSQVQNGEEHVIAFGSFGLSAPQRKYCTTRKELLAIVRFTRQFRHYLLGRQFVIRTDHSSLTWILRFKNADGQLARWLEELAQYDMVIQHRAGAKHINADWLSRPPDGCDCYQAGNDLSKLPCGGCNYCTRMTKQWEQFSLDVDDVLPSTVLDPLKIINAEIRAVNVKEAKENTLHTPVPNWCSTLLVSDIRDKQREDPDLILAVNWVFNETVPTQAELAMSSTVARFYWSNRNLLSEKNEIIYYRWIEDTSSRDLIIVPRALKEVVLSGCHDEITAGHFSSRKTLSRIRQNYFWKNMSQDCSLYVHSCVNCSTQKKANLTARAPLINYQAGNPLDRVHIDILGPFPISRSGNRYVLMLIDQFTRWLEAYPLPDQTAEQVARVVVDQFIARFGSPLYIHSDQGRNFESDLFGSVCELLDIAKIRTTPTHPASNGQVERYNTILLALIRCHIDGASDKWDEAVPLLAGAIRSMQNRHTGMTANMLMLGREVRRPISLAYSFNELVPQSCPHEYVKELLKNFHEVHHLARDKLKTAMKIQKQAYDTKIREADFHVGDLVYRRNLLLKKGDSRKLAPPWVGPFLVVQQLSEVTYKVQGKRRSFVLHHNILRPCRDRSIPFWMRRLRHRFLKNLDQEDDPIMFDHLWDDVKKVSDPSPKYTEPSLRVPIDGIHTPGEFNSNVNRNPRNSEGSNSAIEVVVNEKINEATDLMANKQVNEAINLVPLQEPIISRSGRPRKLPRHLNDYNL